MGLRKVIEASRADFLAYLSAERDRAASHEIDEHLTRRARDRYMGRRDGLDFAMSAVRDLRPEFGGFPIEARFTHPNAGYQDAQDNARRAGLREGQVYVIRTMEVGQSSTYITLYGVPGSFPSGMFEPVWPDRSEDNEPGYKVGETDD